ncbi:MAG: hypothetical protein OXU36_13980 [Candidatus Poribacteria bacterium]|nr:hypothetical protein [Candidatus Poribacteria bacterium]
MLFTTPFDFEQTQRTFRQTSHQTHATGEDGSVFGVSKYQHRLYTHIHGRVKDAEIAKDLTQET